MQQAISYDELPNGMNIRPANRSCAGYPRPTSSAETTANSNANTSHIFHAQVQFNSRCIANLRRKEMPLPSRTIRHRAQILAVPRRRAYKGTALCSDTGCAVAFHSWTVCSVTAMGTKHSAAVIRKSIQFLAPGTGLSNGHLLVLLLFC